MFVCMNHKGLLMKVSKSKVTHQLKHNCPLQHLCANQQKKNIDGLFDRDGYNIGYIDKTLHISE